MKKMLNEEIGKIISLIQRIDEKRNFFDAIDNQKKCINEVMTKIGSRRQVTRNEIIDILEDGAIKGGQYVALTYVCGKKPIVNKVFRGITNWKKDEMERALSNHPDMADKDWHKQLSDFNRDETTIKKNPIANIVVVQRYILNWTTYDSHKKAADEHSEKLRNLRMSYCKDLAVSDGYLGDNHNQRTHSDYNGTQINQTGRLSKDFNMKGSKCKATVYLIDDNGDIIDELPNDVFYAMYKNAKKTESTMQNLLTPDLFQQYEQEKKELDKEFITKNFVFDGMLTIVANVNGESVYYINDKINPSNIKVINQEAFTEIAKEQLGASFEAIQGFEK